MTLDLSQHGGLPIFDVFRHKREDEEDEEEEAEKCMKVLQQMLYGNRVMQCKSSETCLGREREREKVRISCLKAPN